MNQNAIKREFRVISQRIAVDTSSDKPKVSGYAARFNELSEDLGGFRELIAPGAFTDTLTGSPDIRALIDHDSAKVIGRTTSGTLNLTQDDQGLAFTCELPATSYGRDLAISMERGDITGCSFGFYCNDDKWNADDSGNVVRTLLGIDLFEVTVCAFPAYPSSSAQVRSLFPDGLPPDVAKHQRSATSDDCTCPCPECVDGDCDDCSHDDCDCEGCTCDNADDEYLSADIRAKMQMQLDITKL
jgi:HK97 family phage prohead protease